MVNVLVVDAFRSGTGPVTVDGSQCQCEENRASNAVHAVLIFCNC